VLTPVAVYIHAASCDGFQCGASGSNKVCRMRHGQPRCVCAVDCVTLLHGVASGSLNVLNVGRSGVSRQRRRAPTEAALSTTWQGPVCAFDGRTHRNLCSLAKSNCRSGRDLPVEYIGPCQSQFVTLVINFLEQMLTL